jgi:ABC-2 type transport system ATP-binding protein
MAIVEARGLGKSFGKNKALCDLGFDVEAGTVLAMLGPNGAGKTTAVRILTTLLHPDEGSARVDGFDVVQRPHEVRSRIGLTGQYAAVDERLTGRENLDLVGRFFRMSATRSRERATELLREFQLEQDADRVVKGYSGGMRRRIDIAMSLVPRPKVLFLDEPTTGLDPVSRLGTWEFIEELVSRGTTTLLTTQYLDEADRLSDQVLVIDHGGAIARGTSDELKANTGGDRVTLELRDEADVESAERAVREHARPGQTIERSGRSLTIAVRPGTHTPEVVRSLDAAGVPVDDVTLHRPTLDEVFLTLTGRPSVGDETNGSSR